MGYTFLESVFQILHCTRVSSFVTSSVSFVSFAVAVDVDVDVAAAENARAAIVIVDGKDRTRGRRRGRLIERHTEDEEAPQDRIAIILARAIVTYCIPVDTTNAISK